MEAEQLQLLQMATAYTSLETSMAYRELMAWLEDSVESLEMQCAQVPPESKDVFHDYFTLWQQRKKVVNGIKIHVAEYLKAKQDLEDELNAEKPEVDEHQFGGDIRLPGY